MCWATNLRNCIVWCGVRDGGQSRIGCGIALYCVVLCCIALRCIALHYTALYCTVLHCIVLHCIVSYCIALNPIAAAVTRLWARVHFVSRWCRVIIPKASGQERLRIGHHLSDSPALEIDTVMTLNEGLDEWFSDISRSTTFSNEIFHNILTPKQTKNVFIWYQ